MNVLGTGAIFVLDTLSEISSFWSETCRLGKKIWCLKELNDQIRVEDKQENEDSESNFIVYSSFKIIRPFLRTVAAALRWPSTLTTFILVQFHRFA